MEDKKEGERKNSDVISIRIPDFLSFKSKKMKNHLGIISAAIIVVLVAAIFIYVYGIPSVGTNQISKDNAGQKVVDFINSQGQVNETLSVQSVSDLGSIYEVSVSYQGRAVPVYITKQGDYLVQNVVPLNN